MVEFATAALGSLFGGGAATAAATTGAAAGAAATTGFSLSSVLQGGAGLLSAFSSISAGNAQAEALQLQAEDAKRQQPLETIQGISRRSSIRQGMMDQIGGQDVANAASSVDLSFGTPAQARKEAYRQADLGIATDVGTEQTRQARLTEREINYRKMAGKARLGGWLDAIGTGFDTYSSIAGRG